MAAESFEQGAACLRAETVPLCGRRCEVIGLWRWGLDDGDGFTIRDERWFGAGAVVRTFGHRSGLGIGGECLVD